MLTVLTWFWAQPGVRSAYKPCHVNIWADMVRAHLSTPHRVACVTDIPAGIDPSIEIIEPPREFEDWRIPTWGTERPQCLRRITMFAPDAARRFGDRFVCMDLDCVIAGPLDPLFDTDVDFKIYKGTAVGRPYNGSMMLIRAGARRQVYDRFTLDGAIAAGRKFVGSDQAWISHCLGPKEATWGPDDGVHWWGNRRGTGSRVMFFPGRPKPWEIAAFGSDTFVRRHYRRRPQGRCLVLGHAASVWEDLAAVDLGDFDAVIASPEAAKYWTGPILDLACDDRHAERLAAMHGFPEVVFCGRTEEVAA